MRIYIGPANYSLLERRSELWGAPRIVIYLAKVAQGFASIVPLWIYFRVKDVSWSHAYFSNLPYLFLFALGLSLAGKFYGLLTNAEGYNSQIEIIDWVCDCALLTLWCAITYALMGYWLVLVLWTAILWFSYPYSME